MEIKKIIINLILSILLISPVMAYGGIGGGYIMTPLQKVYDFGVEYNLIIPHNNNFILPIEHVINDIKLNFEPGIRSSDAEITIFKINSNKRFHGKEIIYSGMIKADNLDNATIILNLGRDYENIQAHTSENFKNWNLVAENKFKFVSKKYFLIIGDKK